MQTHFCKILLNSMKNTQVEREREYLQTLINLFILELPRPHEQIYNFWQRFSFLSFYIITCRKVLLLSKETDSLPGPLQLRQFFLTAIRFKSKVLIQLD